MAAWILTQEHNAYDQYGEYYCAYWDRKPTQTEVVQALVDLNKPTNWTRERYLRERMPQLLTEADHILTGGGRRNVEDTWYHLREEAPRKAW